MRILGLDPGVNRTGYGILDAEDLGVIDFGVISVPLRAPLPSKLKAISTGIEDIIQQYRPEVAACETIFYGKNIKAALIMGHARGAVLLTAEKSGLQVVEYSPLEVKRAVAGRGRASKEQVRFMVESILDLKEQLKDMDASDALAVAICHLFRTRDRV